MRHAAPHRHRRRRHHHGSRSTPSSMPPIAACSAAAGSTAPSTAPRVETVARPARARRLRHRRGQDHAGLQAPRALRHPHRGSGLGRRRARRGSVAGRLLPQCSRARARTWPRLDRLSRHLDRGLRLSARPRRLDCAAHRAGRARTRRAIERVVFCCFGRRAASRSDLPPGGVEPAAALSRVEQSPGFDLAPNRRRSACRRCPGDSAHWPRRPYRRERWRRRARRARYRPCR